MYLQPHEMVCARCGADFDDRKPEWKGAAHFCPDLEPGELQIPTAISREVFQLAETVKLQKVLIGLLQSNRRLDDATYEAWTRRINGDWAGFGWETEFGSFKVIEPLDDRGNWLLSKANKETGIITEEIWYTKSLKEVFFNVNMPLILKLFAPNSSESEER